MNSLNTMLDQEMTTQVVSRKANLGKSAEIFTIRFSENESLSAANGQAECEDNFVRRRADGNYKVIDECGPDLFFELWDFSDSI